MDKLGQLLDAHRIDGVTLARYLKRPDVDWRALAQQFSWLSDFPEEATEQVVYDLKYAGYIARQQAQVERQARLAEKRIPREFDFRAISHLRTEACEKLARIRPADLAQAARISGITQILSRALRIIVPFGESR